MNCRIVPNIALLASVLFSCVSCQQTTQTAACDDQPRYFRLYDTLDIRVAEVYSPWQQGQRIERYYLVTDTAMPTPDDGVRVQVPLRRIAVTSATHSGFLTALGQNDRIVAMCLPQMVYNQLQQPVIPIGEDIHINNEAVLLAQPDAIFISRYGEDKAYVDRLTHLGVTVIQMVEWKETSPLARAEWIRFMASFVGLDAMADSLFQVTSAAYNDARKMFAHNKQRTTIMSGASYRGTWYVPGGNTYMGQLFRDAGAVYAFQDSPTDSSIPLTMEQAIETFAKADVWVGCNAHSLHELEDTDPKHTWMKAYQTKRVYNFYRRQTKAGANDFWEMGVVHPDWILNDLHWALYPEQMPDYQPVFINHLE